MEIPAILERPAIFLVRLKGDKVQPWILQKGAKPQEEIAQAYDEEWEVIGMHLCSEQTRGIETLRRAIMKSDAPTTFNDFYDLLMFALEFVEIGMLLGSQYSQILETFPEFRNPK